jgi:hypothetical protein
LDNKLGVEYYGDPGLKYFLERFKNVVLDVKLENLNED